ncbi:MAG: N-acetyl-gamma-glutamyl-phosphate reductase [Magnetococcales bacterium]|nr:N-acetyl-gamma-glutamyl-phosphate reductase [Magnetococcales bacterium]
MTIKVGIQGASGYTGGELVRLLARDPEVSIQFATSQRFAGQPMSAIFPHLGNGPELICTPLDDLSVVEGCDLVFCALPHVTSMEVVPELLQRGARVVDLSADFRIVEAETYQSWYGVAHKAPQLLSEAVYGLPELTDHAEIKKARLVANPGCYPTSALLALAPLLYNRLIEPDCIVIDSKSGTSGAGRSPSQGTLFSEVQEGFKSYKAVGHRHTPEIEQGLSRLSGEKVSVRFSPHLIPQSRGILTTCHVKPLVQRSGQEWQALYESYYGKGGFVRVLSQGNLPATNHVRGSNHCHLSVIVDERTGWLVVVSVLDNLVKGAAGQAVQNMNIMFGREEAKGLDQLPLFP